jgi:hypothetical protein
MTPKVGSTYNSPITLGTRQDRLLPDGVPRYVWLYDDGGVTAERYTAVFMGLLSHKKPGEYTCLRMSDDPLGSGHYASGRGRPPYGELGREISLADLPEGCKQLVLDTYREMWNL